MQEGKQPIRVCYSASGEIPQGNIPQNYPICGEGVQVFYSPAPDQHLMQAVSGE